VMSQILLHDPRGSRPMYRVSCLFCAFLNTVGLVLLLIGCAAGFLDAQASNHQPDLFSIRLEDLMNVEVDSVYGASGYKQRVADAPAAITIITGDEIR